MRTIKISTSVLILFMFLVTSCGDKPTTDFSKIKTIDVYVVGKDTCNMTDENGLRQGKWVPNYNNDLKDTVYYENGKIVSK